MSHIIRRAKIDDVLQISDIYVTSLKNAFNGIFNEGYLAKLTPESKYQQWKKNIENSNNIVFVLENDYEILGLIVGSLGSREGKINDQGNILAVYIKPDYKRMGYGKKLVEALFEEFKKHNIVKCVVKVLKNNQDRGFFEHVGGVLVDESPVDEAHVFSIYIYGWDNI